MPRRVSPDAPMCGCGSTRVVKRGYSCGEQRWWCRLCGKTWRSGQGYSTSAAPKLRCRHCFSENTAPNGRGRDGGWRGKCFDCGRRFLQGGLLEANLCGSLLDLRLQQLGIRRGDPLFAELRNQLEVDVREGRGYAWTVEPRLGEASAAVYGSKFTLPYHGYGKEV